VIIYYSKCSFITQPGHSQRGDERHGKGKTHNYTLFHLNTPLIPS